MLHYALDILVVAPMRGMSDASYSLADRRMQ